MPREGAHWSIPMAEFAAEKGPFTDGESFVLVGWIDDDGDGALDLSAGEAMERGVAPRRELPCEDELYPMWLQSVSWVASEGGWMGSANAEGVPCWASNWVVEGETEDWVLFLPAP